MFKTNYIVRVSPNLKCWRLEVKHKMAEFGHHPIHAIAPSTLEVDSIIIIVDIHAQFSVHCMVCSCELQQC